MNHAKFLIICFTVLFACNFSCNSQEQNLKLVSNSVKAGKIYTLHASKDYLYVVNNKGTTILDIHNPEKPEIVSHINEGHFGVCVENDKAYISGNDGLIIADVSDPRQPKILKKYPLTGRLGRNFVNDSYVYITGSNGLEILNVKDIENISHTTYPGENGRCLVVKDDIAYFARSSYGFEVIDISNPMSPKKIMTAENSEGAWDLHINENILYVGCHGQGIKIYDISDILTPKLISTYNDDDGGEAQGVWGDGHYLYVSDNYSIEVFDVSDPAKPIELVQSGKLSASHDIILYKGLIYSNDWKKGLVIYKFK